MLYAFVKHQSTQDDFNWSNVSIALNGQGNFRVPLYQGKISYKQLVAVCPWENRLVALTLRGKHLWQLLEDGAAPMNASHSSPTSSRFLQVAGLRVVYNLHQAPGKRIVSLSARCVRCQVPRYEPVQLEHDYRLVVTDYLADGMNGFQIISDNARELELGPFDMDALIEYMGAIGPITTGLEQRIQFENN